MVKRRILFIQTLCSPAQPALQQIISEAGKVYGGGVGQYVAPTAQTLTGLSQQESDAAAARSQLQSTLAGGYMNPYLNPLIQQAAGDVYTSVAEQFSGAGRTPGSPVSQQHGSWSNRFSGFALRLSKCKY